MSVVPSIQTGQVAVAELEYKSWTEALAALQITHVDALKVDIEGFEWSLLDAWKRQDNLPDQLALEVHFGGEGRPTIRDSSWSEMSMMFLHLANIGYAPSSRDDNFFGRCCTEYGFIRLPRLGRQHQLRP